MRNITFLKAIIIIISLVLVNQTWAQITPHEAVTAMRRGINMGNTLEPELEGGWNNGPAQEYYFDMYKDAGFKFVRVPVRWDKHTGNDFPYTINEDWLNRVEEILDWGLERDLFVIVNMHHEEPLKEDYVNQHIRYETIWSQISIRFKDKSEKLLFEIVNEPRGLSQVQIDEFNVNVLGIIREDNPTRIVIYSGNEWTNSTDLLNAAIPDVNDAYLMAYYHSYEPWAFAGEGNGTWGTDLQVQVMIDQMTSVKNWAEDNNMAVLIGEFGAQRNCDYNSRMFYYATYVEQALAHEFAFAEWDDGGDFETMHRADSSWNDIKDILIYTSDSSATFLAIEMIGDSVVKLSWQSRSEFKQKTIIEKRSLLGEFEAIGEIDASSPANFQDFNIEIGEYSIYRVVEVFNDFNIPSYPVRIYQVSTGSTPYLGYPTIIPGTLEAENFDIGGEMNTYHDKDPVNQGGAYRLGEGVDIEERVDGFQVGFVEPTEWMDYTIDVEKAGKYNLKVSLASRDGGGRLQMDFGYVKSSVINVPSTGDWTTMQVVMDDVVLEEGEQTMRIDIISKPAFNIDKIEFVEYNSILEIEEASISIYPNPAFDNIEIALIGEEMQMISLYNDSGQMVFTKEVHAKKTSLNIEKLDAGIYFVFVNTKNGNIKRKFVKP